MSKKALHNGNSDPGPLPHCLTTCKHCGEIFRSTPFPIVGEPPDKKHEDFAMQLAQHMGTKHPEICATQMIQPQMIYGTALLGMNFTTDDEALAQHIEAARADAHRRTLRFSLPDPSIEEKVSVLALDPEKHEAVCQLICSIRDVYEERQAFSTRPTSGIILPS